MSPGPSRLLNGAQVMQQLLGRHYSYKKTANLGFDETDEKSMSFLNRVVAVQDGKVRQVTVEPDARHAQMVVHDLGLVGAKGVETPIEKRSFEQLFSEWSPSWRQNNMKIMITK